MSNPFAFTERPASELAALHPEWAKALADARTPRALNIERCTDGFDRPMNSAYYFWGDMIANAAASADVRPLHLGTWSRQRPSRSRRILAVGAERGITSFRTLGH